MKKLLTVFLLGIMVLSSAAVVAQDCIPATVSLVEEPDFAKYARVVDFDLQGYDINNVLIFKKGSNYGAGTINLNIISDPQWQPPKVEAYCLDLETKFYGSPYSACIYPLSSDYPIDVMGILVGQNSPVAPKTEDWDNTLGAAIQTAIWKLWYQSNPDFGYGGNSLVGLKDVSLKFYPTGVEDLANEKIATALAVGPIQFAIDVVPNEDLGLVDVLVTGTTGIPGITVETTTTQGVFTANGEKTIDGPFTNGYFATIDLGGAIPDLEVTAVITVPTGTAYLVIGSTVVNGTIVDNQDLIFFGPKPYDAHTSYRVTDDHLGNPRTIGFWKHQFKVAQTSRGNAQVSADDLYDYVVQLRQLDDFIENPPIDFGDYDIDFLIEPGFDVSDGFYLLWLKDATMQERAVQQFFATMLNYLDGQIGMDAMVDIGDEIVPFSEALAKFCYFYGQGIEAEAAEEYKAANEAYEAAKDICDSINNMMQD